MFVCVCVQVFQHERYQLKWKLVNELCVCMCVCVCLCVCVCMYVCVCLRAGVST